MLLLCSEFSCYSWYDIYFIVFRVFGNHLADGERISFKKDLSCLTHLTNIKTWKTFYIFKTHSDGAFFLLINVKKNLIHCWQFTFTFNEQDKSHAQFNWAWKNVFLFVCVLVYLPLSRSLVCLCYALVAFLAILTCFAESQTQSKHKRIALTVKHV